MREVLLSPIEKETALQGLPACIGQPSDRLIHQDAADRVAKAQARKMLRCLQENDVNRWGDVFVVLLRQDFQALKELLEG